MGEFLRRLGRRPGIAALLITASLLCNLLALASPLFVMQVLNRYVSHGVDSTLATLTAGTVAAVLMEFAFRQMRHRMAENLNERPNEEIRLAGFTVLAHGKVQALMNIPAGKRREIVSGATDVETTYNASNLNTILDVPFSVVFLAILFLLSQVIAIIAIGFISAIFIYALVGAFLVRNITSELREVSSQNGSLMETAVREVDMVHAFNGAGFLKNSWFEVSSAAARLRGKIAKKQGLTQTVTQSGTALMSVTVIAFGAILAFRGDLSVGAMIAANILATRAMQPISRLAQLGAGFARARQALEQIEELVQLPLEQDSGSGKKTYSGRVELRDLAFFYPGSTGPLFESLSIKINPGNIVVFAGNSGTGKTTMARLLVGLLEPVRGQILIDGIDLRQVAPEWWRREIVYLPQEPTFLNATIEVNLRLANPEADMSRLNSVINEAGLRRFIDEDALGFETVLTDNGRHLAVGMRRSLALARALMSDGHLVIIDEMFDGFDADGRAAVNAVVNRFVAEKRTVVLMSHKVDRGMEKIAAVVDLNMKPEPRVTPLSEAYLKNIVTSGGPRVKATEPPRARTDSSSLPTANTE